MPNEFSNFPVDILRHIVLKLDPIERLVARKASRCFRQVIDEASSNLEILSIIVARNKTILCLNTQQIEYDIINCHVLNQHHFESAFINATELLKNPKLKLKDFKISLTQDTLTRSNCLLQLFESISHPLFVQNLDLKVSQQQLLSILPCFKPGILRRIWLHSHDEESIQFQEVAQLEQWKKAKIAIISKQNIIENIECFLHFDQFEVRVSEFDENDVRRMLKTLLTSPSFVYCYIVFPCRDITAFAIMFEPSYDGAGNYARLRYKTKCDAYFVVTITSQSINVVRIKC